LTPAIWKSIDLLTVVFYRFVSPSFFTALVFKFVIAFATLLLPTFLMGATLPILSKYFVHHNEDVAKNVGFLYGLNTLGAVLGVLFSGFIALQAFGVWQTVYLTGIDNVLDLADAMGYTTLKDRSRFGLALVLGGGEVTLLEHTQAFSVLAQEGLFHPATPILKVENKDGNIIEEWQKTEKRVLDPELTRLTNSILTDNEARAFIFGEQNYLTLPDRQVAAKTGTTQNYNDGWTMGYTPSMVVGVWVGNNDNSSTKDIGVGLAAPIWRKVMEKLLTSHDKESFTPPDPITNRNPALLGQLPPGDTHTILYYIDKNNPLGPQLQNPSSDPQYFLWQAGINNWLAVNGEVNHPVP